MNNQLQAFLNNEFGNVRGVNINGEVYLVAKDIVEKLGYNLTGKHVASEYVYKFVDEEDYILIDKETAPQIKGEFNYKELGQRGGLLINESGFYALVFGSKLESAKRFKKWVTSEVLPSIRKTGSYSMQNTPSYMITDPIERAKKWIEEETVRQEQIKMIEEQKPKVDYHDKVLTSESNLTITQIAKSYGKSAKTLNNILYELGVQYKISNQWVLYSKYQGLGYVVDTTFVTDKLQVKHTTKWTEKGRQFIHKLLVENGYWNDKHIEG